MTHKTTLLEHAIAKCVEGLGYEWVGAKAFSQGNRTILRVYADKPGGLTIQDCERISHQLRGVLAVEGQDRHSVLEVSSPGLDRPLFTPEQYRRFVGHVVRVHLIEPKDERRVYKGVLLAVRHEGICLQEGGSTTEILFSSIKKAHLIPEYEK